MESTIDTATTKPVTGEVLPNPAHELLTLLQANLPAQTQRNNLRYRDAEGRQLAATSDPTILARRAYAMPLWNDGLTGQEVMLLVNEWLETRGVPPVTLQTIRNDHKAVFFDWEADFEHSSAENRASHIATLMRVKQEAMNSYRMLRDKGKQGGGSASAYLKLAMQADMEIARLDGSIKRAEVMAEQAALDETATTIVRVYKNVDLDKV